MTAFLLANGGTIVVGAIVLAAVTAIVIKIIKDKKNGKGCCTCGCEGCGCKCR